MREASPLRIIAGKWKGRTVSPAPGLHVRPTAGRVREAWMAILGPRLAGATVADLFAGSGALGLEALSRGASHVTFVEQSHRAVGVLERNIADLNAAGRSAVVRGDAVAHVRNLGGARYDIALADPPYDQGFARQLLALHEQSPFAAELWIEHHAMEPVTPAVPAVQRRYGRTMLTSVRAPSRGLAMRPARPAPARCPSRPALCALPAVP